MAWQEKRLSRGPGCVDERQQGTREGIGRSKVKSDVCGVAGKEGERAGLTNNNKEQEDGKGSRTDRAGEKRRLSFRVGCLRVSPNKGPRSRNVSRELAPPMRLPWYDCCKDQRRRSTHPKRLHASVVAYLVVSVCPNDMPRGLCGNYEVKSSQVPSGSVVFSISGIYHLGFSLF